MLFRTADIKELQRKRCIEEFRIINPVGNIQNTSTVREENLLQQPWPASVGPNLWSVSGWRRVW